MLYLHQLPKFTTKNYSYSPFCLKMELYLKAVGLSYENNFSLEFGKSPTNKMPFIELQDKKFADSNLIISYLKSERDIYLNEHLDKKQNAISKAFIRLCEDSLYWSLMYSRWYDNSLWQKEFIETTSLPKIMAKLVYNATKKNVARQLKFQGTTVLAETEIYQKFTADIEAIANFLDKKKYFFNEQISLLDITVFSFLIMVKNGSCGKKALSIYNNYPNLDIFNNNIEKLYGI